MGFRYKQQESKSGVNHGGNMDRGAMTFTSDVSLPKDSKQLCWMNKLQLGDDPQVYRIYRSLFDK